MTYKLVLDSNYSEYSTDLEYQMQIVRKITDTGRQRSYTTIPLPEPENSRHFGFKPGTVEPSFEFTIYDNGEDKSNGSYHDSNISDARITSTNQSGETIIKTVDEQIVWLTEYVHDNTSDPRWKIFGGRFSDIDGDGTDEGANAVVKTPKITERAGFNAADCILKIKLGVTI